MAWSDAARKAAAEARRRKRNPNSRVSTRARLIARAHKMYRARPTAHFAKRIQNLTW